MASGFRAGFGLIFALTFVSACSSVGPGFANHPVDCAVGIPWADCLPGTAGYNNGGGSVTRAQAAKEQADALVAQAKAENAQCLSDMQNPELDLIRHKVELYRASPDEPPPFEVASNDTFPTPEERTAIAKWASIKEECVKRAAALPPQPATPLQLTFIQQDRAFMQEANGRVSGLIVALYQAKLTYGEFAQRRYEITKEAATAERQFRASALIADRDRQIQAQQLAQQQFQNNLIAWSNYMQSVNARQPQTVRLSGSVNLSTHCLSQQLGQFVSTNCQ